MNRRVIVTGASGFIGSNLVRRLLKRRFQVHAIVSQEYSSWRIADIQKKLIIHKGLLEKKSLKSILNEIKPYAIFHLATFGSYPDQKDVEKVWKVNVLDTIGLLDAVKDLSIKRIIVSGSSSEYGKKLHSMKESDVLEPNNMYAVAKTAQTHVCKLYAYSYSLPITIVRLFNVYGFYEQEGRLVRSVIESSLQNKPIRLATGDEARDFIFCEDVVAILLKLITTHTLPGEVFNVGTGKQTTIKQLAEKVIRLTKSKSQIQLNSYPGRVWDSPSWVADMTKTNTELNWSAHYSLEEGLKKTVDWYKKLQK